ncbi:actin cortical patch SUR7/pH-response regulator pali [Mycena belliarum]|uniref:Actin cortical patch SUR7/pH-response regulator pali n=1 Tax=Mycena belliarum TaxID=1033014 RepID=A0AAD6TUJ3_9AGAR|nr:actin cortical patch SUR7/pH-response regulator pali [Mycena belliae]
MSAPLHAGTFLIFSGMVLLIVASISAPTVSKINFLQVHTANNASTVNFGTLGYCVANPGENSCTPTGVGYRIADEIQAVGIDAFSRAKAVSLHGLTQGLILHQIGAGIAAIAFLMALCSHRIGYLFASAVAFIAFLFSLAALILDFVLFGSVRSHVRDDNGSAKFGNAIWIVLAATIVLFLASIATCFACVTARKRRRSASTKGATY